ncbi:uncharacterized protein LOC128557620 [Mercenaria mercenaria]|uniref:uncharacterized protein LOC128557620 n=1 Tax=Mercenaria mercenaria TaxID=6596 RepID=UPI00234E4C3E|nr:uncharacterized protein LOC128557620 [Mercenaria mercenaria]
MVCHVHVWSADTESKSFGHISLELEISEQGHTENTDVETKQIQGRSEQNLKEQLPSEPEFKEWTELDSSDFCSEQDRANSDPLEKSVSSTQEFDVWTDVHFESSPEEWVEIDETGDNAGENKNKSISQDLKVEKNMSTKGSSVQKLLQTAFQSVNEKSSAEKKNVYISLWPSKRESINVCTVFSGVESKCFESLKEEIRETNCHPTVTYHLTDLKETAITEWWNQFKRHPQQWSCPGNSCSNIVFRALCVGSEWFVGRNEAVATTPESVRKLVKSYLKQKDKRINSSNKYPWSNQ